MTAHQHSWKEYEEKKERERERQRQESAERTRARYAAFATAVQTAAPGDEIAQARLIAGLGVDYLIDHIEEYVGDYDAKAALEVLGNVFPWLEQAIAQAKALMEEKEGQ